MKIGTSVGAKNLNLSLEYMIKKHDIYNPNHSKSNNLAALKAQSNFSLSFASNASIRLKLTDSSKLSFKCIAFPTLKYLVKNS
jgi:hypothetical protein